MRYKRLLMAGLLPVLAATTAVTAAAAATTTTQASQPGYAIGVARDAREEVVQALKKLNEVPPPESTPI